MGGALADLAELKRRGQLQFARGGGHGRAPLTCRPMPTYDLDASTNRLVIFGRILGWPCSLHRQNAEGTGMKVVGLTAAGADATVACPDGSGWRGAKKSYYGSFPRLATK